MIKEIIKNIPRDLSGVNDLISREEQLNQTEFNFKIIHVGKRSRLFRPIVGHPHFISTFTHLQTLNDIKIVNRNGASLKIYEEDVELPCQEMVGEYDQIFPMITLDMNDLFEKIISFKTLQESWDGYGALPLEAQSAKNAIYLITKFSDSIKSKISNVRPNPNGTITFEWENSVGERLVNEIGNRTMSYYLKLNSTPPNFENDVSMDDQSIFKMVSMVKRLFL